MVFYKVNKINSNLYSIQEKIFGDAFPIYIYLVIGTEKAALIDTGFGTGNLRNVIASITELPVIVLHTHGHVDHIGADALFDLIYMNAKEYAASDNGYIYNLTPERRLALLKNLLNGDIQLYEAIKDHIVQELKTDYINIDDGDIIDLGDLQLEAVATPGHTLGSVSYINAKDHYAFTGDGIADIHWFDSDILQVEDFLQTINHFEARSASVENIYAAHIPNPFGLELIHDLQRAAREIIDGSNDIIENADYMFLKHGNLYAHRSGKATIYYNKENSFVPGNR